MLLVDRWLARARTLRVMALLIAARLLIARVPFRVWRGWLGGPALHEPSDPQPNGDAQITGRRLAAQVERAAWRLPFEVKCLPRAMALSWLLTHERIPHAVVVAVRPPGHRGDGDDLHAWVEHGGAIILGDLPGPWLRLFEQGCAAQGTTTRFDG